MYNFLVFFLQLLIALLFYLLIEKRKKRSSVINSKQSDTVYTVALLCLTVFAVSIRVYNGHNSGGDFSEYIAQAKSIVDGTMNEQVSTNTFIVTNSHFQFGPFAYPWGYPLLLAPIYKLFGMNYIALKSVNCIFFVAMIMVLYRVYSKAIGKSSAFLASCLVVFIPVNLRLADNVLSDMTFCFFSVISVYAIYRLTKAETKQLLWSLLVGFAAFFAFFIRTAGIVSLMTLFAADLISAVGYIIKPLKNLSDKFELKKRSIIMRSVPYLVFILGYIAVKFIFPQSDSGYENYIENLSIHSIASNILKYTVDLKEMFNSGYYLSYILIIVVAVLVIIGIIKDFFSKTVYIIYSFGMFVLIMLFPEYQGIRYLISILPWIIMASFSAAEIFRKRILLKQLKIGLNFKTAFISVVCATLLFSTYSSVDYLKNRIKNPENMNTNSSYNASAIELYSFIKDNTKESDVIVFKNPRLIWLNTERRSISVEENNLDKLDLSDYILININEDSFMKSYISSMSGIKPVFSNEAYMLYKAK